MLKIAYTRIQVLLSSKAFHLIDDLFAKVNPMHWQLFDKLFSANDLARETLLQSE